MPAASYPRLVVGEQAYHRIASRKQVEIPLNSVRSFDVINRTLES
jgi:hypothetical protein